MLTQPNVCVDPKLDDDAFIDSLLRDGYAYTPFVRTDAQAALSAFRAFLRRKTQKERDRWTCFVETHNDPDYGYIRKGNKSGEDQKHLFHWLPMLDGLLREKRVPQSDADAHFMDECAMLFHRCNELVYRIAEVLDGSGRFPISFVTKLKKAEMNPAPFSRSGLRLGEYDVTATPTRAQPHQDRSFLSLQVFSIGGTLYRYDNGAKENPHEIVIPDNSAVMFFGQKAEYMSRGACRAVWHGAEAADATRRSIAVFFAHANMALQHARYDT